MNTPDRIAAAMPIMAHVHWLMAGLPEDTNGDQPLFANHVEPWEVVARTTNGINRVKAWDPTESEIELCTIAENLAQRVAAGEEEFLPGLRYQRAHGDFWDNNVFFRDGEIVLVADFDYMGRTARTDDLARTLYFAISSRWTGHNHYGELIEYAASLVEAYNSIANPPLTRLERLVLPLSIVRESLSWVANWLPDLDDQEMARKGFGEGRSDLAMAQLVLDNLRAWQTSFTA
jgi:Ser/Thr protein kinase RdoA (MazF antagonist)